MKNPSRQINEPPVQREIWLGDVPSINGCKKMEKCYEIIQAWFEKCDVEVRVSASEKQLRKLE